MTLKTASVLAFDRKLNTSDALFYAGNWSDRENSDRWKPVGVTEKSVRGTISNRLKSAIASDPAKVDNEVQKANLQTVDAAALPADADTLKVVFTLRALGGISQPSACNSTEYQAKLVATIDGYLQEHQCKELAYRYACNLANGRFLWRNRVGAESVEVVVQANDNAPVTFDGYAEDLDIFPAGDTDRQAVADALQQGLMGQGFSLLTVTASVKLGKGQEVYPSQELVLKNDNKKIDGKNKTKYLYHVAGVAGMHSQKVSNALRTIDTWHSEADTVGPIAVEPYGSVTSRGAAYRQPKQKMDFYNLLDGWVLKDKVPELEQQHYVIATLIRGGVFGEAG